MDPRQPTTSNNVMTQEVWNQMSPAQQQQYMAQWQYYQQLQREALLRQQASQPTNPQAQVQYQWWLQQQAAQIQAQQEQSPATQTDAYHEWLQRQIAEQQQLQSQQGDGQRQTVAPVSQVQSDPSAYQQRLQQIEQEAGENQPVFSQPWLSPEQQAAKQAEMQSQADYQPQQLAEQPAAVPQPEQQPTAEPQSTEQSSTEPIPTQSTPESTPQPAPPPEQAPPPVVEVGPHATVDHSHDNDTVQANSWKVTQTIGGESNDAEALTAKDVPKKSHKKLTVLMSTLIFAAVGTAIVVVFSMISQADAKTLSCNHNGQNNSVADLVSFETTLKVRLTGEKFSDITTTTSLMFSNGVDAQNYVNSGGDGRVSETMMTGDAEYIKSTSGAVIEDNKVNYSTTYSSGYIGLIAGVGADLDSYRGTSEQLVEDAKKNLENIGYTCSYK